MCGDPECPSCGPAQGYVTAGQQVALEEEAKAVAHENLRDAAWWEIMNGEEDVGAAAAACLARCMANRAQACKGELIALNAIIEALSNLHQVAQDRAFNDAMDEWETMGE